MSLASACVEKRISTSDFFSLDVAVHDNWLCRCYFLLKNARDTYRGFDEDGLPEKDFRGSSGIDRGARIGIQVEWPS